MDEKVYQNYSSFGDNPSIGYRGPYNYTSFWFDYCDIIKCILLPLIMGRACWTCWEIVEVEIKFWYDRT